MRDLDRGERVTYCLSTWYVVPSNVTYPGEKPSWFRARRTIRSTSSLMGKCCSKSRSTVQLLSDDLYVTLFFGWC